MATLVFYLDDGSTLTHALEGEVTTLGRHPDSVVVLDFPSVSSRHALIEEKADGVYVTDNKSSNGTRVNGAEIEEAKLQDGDRLGFGDVQAVFYEGEAPAELPPQEIFVPAPDIIVEAPPPMPATNYKPQRRGPSPIRRNRAGYQESSGGGCVTALLIIVLFIGAFLTGLYLRHSKDTEGGNFFTDMVSKLNSIAPKIKIEQPK